MKLLIDMNLSPTWVDALASGGIEAVHWSQVGSPAADDNVIFEWASNQGFAVLTNDLDFGAMLALTSAAGPSVVQIRSLRLAPRDSAPLLIPTLRRFEQQIEAGCLLILQESSSRIRLLPLGTISKGEERSDE